MKTIVISCELFRWLIDESKYPDYDFVYLEVARHDEPAKLNQRLQEEINKSQGYDRIILLYGLCGNAIIGLTSPVDLFVYRSHDCSSVLLGNKSSYINHRWSCYALCKCDYYGDISNDGFKEYEEKYGEHAQYLWEMLRKDEGLYYVCLDGFDDKKALNNLANKGHKVEKKLPGTLEVLDAILEVQDHPMIFRLPANKKIKGVYDLVDIITFE